MDSISELKRMSVEELQEIRTFGRKGLEEIAACFNEIVPDRSRSITLVFDVGDVERLALDMAKIGEKDISAYICRLIREGLRL